MSSHLWSPWRIKYIKQKKKGTCIFCSAAKSKNDQANHLLLRGKYSFLIFNIYPYNNGHLMVAPYRHKATLQLLSNAEIHEMMILVKRAQKILTQALKPHGFNIGLNEGKFAGAGIEKHLHIHIVPRWLGDTNFMPVISGTKVIPQLLNDLYLTLKKLL